MSRIPVRTIVISALTAAAYASLTTLLAPISYGPVQFRVSEALNILPFFMPGTAVGLFLGCAIANLMSTAGLPDIIFGSLATLLSALCVSRLGRAARNAGHPFGYARQSLACLMPVLWNGPVIGAVLAYTFASPDSFMYAFAVMGAQVAFGEAVVMFVIGLPLMRVLPRFHHFRELCGLPQDIELRERQ